MIKKGRCICDAVQYECTGEPLHVTVCHCTWCQRRTGSAFGIEVVYKENQIIFHGKLSHYTHISDDSDRWLKVFFCSNCGTNLGFMLEAANGIRTIAAGTFDDSSWIDPENYCFKHVYVKSKQNWSVIPAGVEQHHKHFRK